MVLHVRRPRPARHPRSRTARGEPVPRPQPAGRLAARVRRPGDRPGAGRRLPHRRGPAAAFAARLFPAGRRSQGADHLRGRPHPRRQELHHPARGRDPARPGDLLDVGVVPRRRAGPRPPVPRCRTCRSPTQLPSDSRDQGAHPAADAGAGAPLLRARAADRAAAGRVRPLPRQDSPRTAASTSGSAPPAGCRTIRRSIAACWPMRPT